MDGIGEGVRAEERQQKAQGTPKNVDKKVMIQ